MDTDKLNRLEIIDHRKNTKSPGRTVIISGPAYKQPDNVKIELSFQDDERTLKVFLSDKDDE